MKLVICVKSQMLKSVLTRLLVQQIGRSDTMKEMDIL